MKLTTWILAGSALVALAGPVHAQTAQQFTDRDSAYTLDISGGLASAVTTYTVTATMPAGGVSAPGYSLNYKSGFQNFFFNNTGSVTNDYAAPIAGSTGEIGDIINGGGGGTFQFGYQTLNGADPSTSWTELGVAGGYQVLAFGGIGSQGFGGCGSSFLDIGGIFTCEVFISGDHPQGTASGDAYLTNLGAGYNIISDFAYGGSSFDYTVLSVSTGNYQGAGPNLAFNIVGAALAVPEPATWTMMLMGFGGLGVAMRAARRTRQSIV